jgi:hypothetical protein
LWLAASMSSVPRTSASAYPVAGDDLLEAAAISVDRIDAAPAAKAMRPAGSAVESNPGRILGVLIAIKSAAGTCAGVGVSGDTVGRGDSFSELQPARALANTRTS